MTERDEATGMTTEARVRRQLETVPLQRLGKVEDIAGICVFFASDESEWISGQVVQVNGGSRIPLGLITFLWKMNHQTAAGTAKPLQDSDS
mgnify:CR=1 FL=1